MTTLPPVDLEARFLALGLPQSPAEERIFHYIRKCLADRAWAQEQQAFSELHQAAANTATFLTGSILAYLTAVEAYREKPVSVCALRPLPVDYAQREARITCAVLRSAGITTDETEVATWSEDEQRLARRGAAALYWQRHMTEEVTG